MYTLKKLLPEKIVNELSKAHYVEMALKDFVNNPQDVSAAAPYSILIDKYTDAYANKQQILSAIENETLQWLAQSFVYETSVEFHSKTYTVRTTDEAVIDTLIGFGFELVK